MLGSDMFSRYSGNLKLLKRKTYFKQHKGVSEIDIAGDNKTEYNRKKLSQKEILKIREEMSVEEKKEHDRKILILLLSVIVTIILISVIIYLIGFIPDNALDFPSEK